MPVQAMPRSKNNTLIPEMKRNSYMVGPNNFKSDDSFLRKIAVGAAGTNATIVYLRSMGFNPIKLDRGSTGFKIWKKIKTCTDA